MMTQKKFAYIFFTRALLIITLLTTSTLLSSTELRAQEEQPAWLAGTVIDGVEQEVYPWLRLRVNIAARKLSVIEKNQVIAVYDVAIGSPQWPTPVMMGETIKHIIWNPSWFPPDSPWAKNDKVTPPGPRNPLGPVKMPIARGIMIHGTTKPQSVGRAASHGCFRMVSEDAATLAWYIQSHATDKRDPSLWESYQRNRTRTSWVKLEQPLRVDIVYEPVEIADGMLTIYPDVYNKVRDWNKAVQDALVKNGIYESPTPSTIAFLRKQSTREAASVPVEDVINNRLVEAQR